MVMMQSLIPQLREGEAQFCINSRIGKFRNGLANQLARQCIIEERRQICNPPISTRVYCLYDGLNTHRLHSLSSKNESYSRSLIPPKGRTVPVLSTKH